MQCHLVSQVTGFALLTFSQRKCNCSAAQDLEEAEQRVQNLEGRLEAAKKKVKLLKHELNEARQLLGMQTSFILELLDYQFRTQTPREAIQL